MSAPKNLIPLPELVSQTHYINEQMHRHMRVQKPEVRCQDIDDVVLLRKELKDGEQLAIHLLGHMLEQGIYK